MKRLVLPLIVAIALPSAAEVKIPRKVHNECKEVADYRGCVELNTPPVVGNLFAFIMNFSRNFHFCC